MGKIVISGALLATALAGCTLPPLYLTPEQQAQQANYWNAMAASAVLLQESGPHYYAPPPTQTTCVQQGVFMNCTTH